MGELDYVCFFHPLYVTELDLELSSHLFREDFGL